MNQFKITFKPAYEDVKHLNIPKNVADELKKPKVEFYDQTESYLLNDFDFIKNTMKIEIL